MVKNNFLICRLSLRERAFFRGEAVIFLSWPGFVGFSGYFGCMSKKSASPLASLSVEPMVGGECAAELSADLAKVLPEPQSGKALSRPAKALPQPKSAKVQRGGGADEAAGAEAGRDAVFGVGSND